MSRWSKRSEGFTLIEVMLSIAIIAIIMLGVQSAILLASRATPARTSAVARVVAGSRAMDQLQAELSVATSVSVGTATSIQFTCPDRTGDGASDDITYSWSGASGQPLYRSINGAAARVMVENISVFQLGYDKRTSANATTYTESGETLLASNDGLGLLNLGDADIDSTHWYGQYFKPTLPTSAVQWRVTRAKFKAQKHGPAIGQTRVQIRAATSGGLPTLVLDEAVMNESTLPGSYAWQEFSFTNAAGRSPGAGACLVFQWSSDADSCDILYQSLLSLPINSWMVRSTNGGQSWSIPALQSLVYYVYGTYSTTDAASSTTSLASVRCTLQAGSDVGAKLSTSIQMLNEPQITW